MSLGNICNSLCSSDIHKYAHPTLQYVNTSMNSQCLEVQHISLSLNISCDILSYRYLPNITIKKCLKTRLKHTNTLSRVV